MKKTISLLLTAIMVIGLLPMAVVQDAFAAAELVVTGGSYYYDGHEHDVTVEVKDGNDYTIEYSTDGGATWGPNSPTLTEPGKLTVNVRAKKGTEILGPKTVTLEITDTAPAGSTVKIVAHESDTKAPAHKSASSSSETLGKFNAGETCTLLSQSGNWFKVTNGTLTGFVYYWFVKVTSTPDEGGGGTPDLGKVKLTVTGGTYLYDGKEHKVVAKMADGDGFTVEFSTDGGKTWSTTAPSLTAPGKLTVKVQATSTAGIKTHPDVVLQVVSSVPSGTKVKIKAHGSTKTAPIRKLDNSSSTKLGTISAGTECTYLDRTEEWVKITYGEIEGYVYEWFVDFDNLQLRPTITSQPDDVVAAKDSDAVFKVIAKGEGSLSYRWQEYVSGSWKDVTSGGTSPSYSVKATTANNGKKVRCIVTDANSTVTSNEATLKVITAAPTITTQPVDLVETVGKKVVFSVVASGEALSYQWYTRASASDAWEKTSALKQVTISKTKASHDGRQYYCRVSNPCGKVDSDIATLNVVTKPVILSQPTDCTVNSGDKASFTVMAMGKSLSIRWEYRTSPTAKWKKTSGKKATYKVTTKARHDGYQYRAVVSNSYGKVYSDIVTLTVIVVPPTISTQPTDLSVNVGDKASFKVKATSSDLTYGWEYRENSSSPWKKISSAAGKKATYTFTTKAKHNGYQYRVHVSNPAGDVYSNVVTLSLVTYPVISAQPSDTTVFVGQTAKFKVTAKGPKLSYQWYYRVSSSSPWKKVTNSTGKKATLKVSTKLKHNGYEYKCVVKNAYGEVTSSIVKLTVS